MFQCKGTLDVKIIHSSKYKGGQISGYSLFVVFFSFLLAKEKGTSRPVAFVSYRYDIDEGDEVVYWYVNFICANLYNGWYALMFHSYEIQLEPEVRRKGLGKFLMQILELIGHRCEF